MIASYEAVTNRILGLYVGLCLLPAFDHTLESTSQHWASQYLPELLPGDPGLEPQAEVLPIVAAGGPAGQARHGRAPPPPQPPPY